MFEGGREWAGRILFKSIMILYIPQNKITPLTRALVLAIGVCYHAKLLERREEYRTVVARSFKAPCLLPGGHKQIHREISRYEKSIMQCGLLHLKELMTQPFGPFTYPNRKILIAASQLIVLNCVFYKDKEGFGPYLCGVDRSVINRKRVMEFGFLLTP